MKDRLAAYYHWDDKQGLEQAINICLEQDVASAEVERWSLQENQMKKFRIFVERLKRL